jgi:hypothetical protein
MYAANMKNARIIGAVVALGLVAASACMRAGKQDTHRLTLAINSGVEGDALKQAAKDYEAQTGI